VVKRDIYEFIAASEQQFYDEVRLILKQAGGQAYDSANGIMTHAYWNVGRRIADRSNMVKRKRNMLLN
jgi:hypothetical protein